MAPWWIRPTSDEVEQDQETQEQQPAEKREEPSPVAQPSAEVRREVSVELREVSEPLAPEGAVEESPQAGSVPEPPTSEATAPAVTDSEATASEATAPEPSSERAAPSRSRSRRGGRGRRRGPRTQETPSEQDRDVDDSNERSARSPRPEQPAVEELEESETNQPSLEAILREIFLDSPQRSASDETESKIALFCDFENIALGVRQSHNKKFEISLVLERLIEKGKVIVKKAYSDWSRYSDYKKTFHEAGIELIEIPQKYYSGKNSADIKMVVDAMDLCYSNEHIDTYVILSGDSDFSPLVSKLKENNKYVIGVGVKDASSNLLIDNCDEFIYYEDLWRDAQTAPLMAGLEAKDAEAFGLMTDAMKALIRENKEVLWGSMVKQTMKRKKPSFNEGYYGYRTFSELLEDAEDKGIVSLRRDKRSGSYIVTGYGGEG